MRIIVVALLFAIAPAAGAVEPQESASVCTGDLLTEYPCEWQRKVIVNQREFAASLEAVDQITTGSITPKDR